MLKRITFVVVGLIFLMGTADLFARQKEKKSQARPGQKQRAQAKKVSSQKQKGSERAGPNRTEALRRQHQQEAAKKNLALRRKQQQAAAKRAQAMRDRHRQATARKGAPVSRAPSRPLSGRPELRQAGQIFGQWLDQLTDAYRTNNREKMGALIKRMNEIRQRFQRTRAARGQLGGGWGLGAARVGSGPRSTLPTASKGQPSRSHNYPAEHGRTAQHKSTGASPGRQRTPAHSTRPDPTGRGGTAQHKTTASPGRPRTPEHGTRPAPHGQDRAGADKSEHDSRGRPAPGPKKPASPTPRRPAPRK